MFFFPVVEVAQNVLIFGNPLGVPGRLRDCLTVFESVAVRVREEIVS